MQSRLGRWLRLGEILHVGEFAIRFPKAFEAFQMLRHQKKGTKIRTFRAQVDLAFKEDWRKGVDLLAARPGEFARKLDWMLRKFDRMYVLEVFGRVGAKVSAKVLFEMNDHFAARMKEGSPRAIHIKGKRSKMKMLPALPPLSADTVQNVGNVIQGILRAAMARLPELGRVWIDPRLKEVPLPFAMRSVNTSIKTYIRGTRVPFRADAKVIRPFIHWFDEEGNQDLDLSCGFYDESLNYVAHISFTNLKDETLNCCHSGDIRHRQGPCAEYVDIDIEKCVNNGVRYAVVHVFNFNARPMHTVKECVFGLMEREYAVANEIFLPKTISNCMALANEGTGVTVCVIDLQRRDYIWADLESDRVLPTVENAADKTMDVLLSLIHGTKMPVYDLLAMHAQARGTLVADVAAADAAFKWEDFVSDYAKVATFMYF